VRLAQDVSDSARGAVALKIAPAIDRKTAMETLVKSAWGLLALIHLAPAAVLFAPASLRKLYGIEPQGDLGVLLTHRGALFLAVVVLCVFGVLDPAARRAASVAVGISVLGFLVVYVRAGFPQGALRTIALVDTIALVPLIVVIVTAWRSGSS
jgi:hypothetical protein